ncbi:hypothetical protein SMD20_39950 [Nonomuraea sp. LP-02]|uniref:hypothetical protein n=1 Tax=Nonomuraea sp. LP-02 TaxID=3097960 RepID=UPI002E34E9AF|nr:hypothetical protein [Nonomuraea sp. LP-02]MED7930454.1 hypothetical protein [Nonomuraea sp. LP-02]
MFLGEHARVDLTTTLLGPLIAHIPMHQTSDQITGETLRIHIDPARCQVEI